MKSIHLIAAARPNFMKVVRLYHELKKTDWAEPAIAHIGQRYGLQQALRHYYTHHNSWPL